jgi:hypothetical protein
MTKQERISDEAVEALREFAPGMSITSAIIEMSKRVKSDESWAEFEAHVIKAVNEAGRRNVTTAPEKEIKSVTTATKSPKPVTSATGFDKASNRHPDKTITNPDGSVVKKIWNERMQQYDFGG